MASRYSLDIDAAFIDRATGELFACLWSQRQAYLNRFYSSRLVKSTQSILRYLGLSLSILGLLLCVVIAVLSPRWCPAWLVLGIFVPVFLAFILIFYYLPKLEQYSHKWAERFSRWHCDKVAKNCMSKLRGLVPITVEYEFNGERLTCFRCRGEQRTPAWVKRLSGVAFQSDAVTSFLKKKTSIYPSIIVLHRNPETINEALRELSIESVAVDVP